MFQRILASVCLACFLLGCTSGPEVIRLMPTRLVPTSDADTKGTQNGVTIEVTPIDPTTIGNYPQLNVQTQAQKKGFFGVSDADIVVPNGLKGATFALKITNNTGYILNLVGSSIYLTVQGQALPQATKNEILNAWAAYFAQNYLLPGVPLESITTKVNSLPFWDESTPIPPGQSKEVFIVFNTQLQRGIGEAVLTIHDLVTQTDAAGNPTERATFNFAFMEKIETNVNRNF